MLDYFEFYVENGFDLILSGYMYGGIVCILYMNIGVIVLGL